MALTQMERKALRWDHGFSRVIEAGSGEIHAIKDGKRVFVAWNAEDARQQLHIKNAIQRMKGK